jgi:hypothetical protein
MTARRTHVRLSNLEPALTLALEELLASDLARRPFIIVDDPVTKKFIQFARRFRPRTGELLFDVPALGIELRPCPEPSIGARWARFAFTDQFELPLSAEIVITEDGDPEN